MLFQSPVKCDLIAEMAGILPKYPTAGMAT
jgi:hypothetical protein